MLTLNQLRRGQRATIAGIEGEDALMQRLLEMGLLEGEEVEILGIAPFGDPLEILVQNYRLSLRKSEAARIIVKILD
jgi:ferrous iron transport protein A